MSDTETVCRCGHERTAHEHYRSGTDCALCGAGQCDRFSAVTAPGDTQALDPLEPTVLNTSARP